jgi:glycosyltransferase involved in cell wall biosynthesis
VLVARAGAWLRRHLSLHLPRTPGLVALGSSGHADWTALLTACGGDLAQLQRRWRWRSRSRRPLPFTPVFFLEEAEPLAEQLLAGRSLDEALASLVFAENTRAVRLPALGASHSPSLRVLQVVTTIQTGGAERITLDLAAELNHQGISTAVAALGQPTRQAYPAPPHFVSLAEVPNSPEARARAIADSAIEWGADVVHAHLLRDADTRAIKALGLPLALTIHNARPGWPAGLENADASSADLLLGCAQCVTEQLGPLPGLPVRTLLNGIVPATFAPTPERAAAGRALREKLGLPASARVLVSLANPRPQKRLELLPPVLALLPDTHLLLAGDPGAGRGELVLPVEQASAAAGVSDRVHWLGTAEDVPALLAAADALISLSGWEGLSLAHLEALAAEKPVIATDAGGTREIAARHPGLILLPLEASPAAVAEAVRTAFAGLPPAPFPRCFTRYQMARRAARLYRRLLAPAPAANTSSKTRLWLVTNNFSTGGAQSSARRLLTALAADPSIEVRAAVVQEDPRRPTPGRLALEAAGISVTAVPPPESCDAADACATLLDAMDAAPPDAVVFWNLITSYKIILADSLLHTRVVDVSPGGMYYTAMDNYFQEPRPDFPCRTSREYGALLGAMVVKYARESPRALDCLGLPPVVIPNGLHAGEDPAPAAPKKPGAPLVLATAARLSPDKCLPELLAALRLAAPHLPPWKLRVAGGPERDHRGYERTLRRMARGLPVEWCGALPDTRSFLASADVFVMISEPPGCPNASLEALAAGLPVIATDVGGVSEQVVDGVTGLLVPPADAAALSAAIVRLAGDEALRTKLGAAGRRHVQEHFSLEKMVARYRAVLLDSSHSSPALP